MELSKTLGNKRQESFMKLIKSILTVAAFGFSLNTFAATNDAGPSNSGSNAHICWQFYGASGGANYDLELSEVEAQVGRDIAPGLSRLGIKLNSSWQFTGQLIANEDNGGNTLLTFLVTTADGTQLTIQGLRSWQYTQSGHLSHGEGIVGDALDSVLGDSWTTTTQKWSDDASMDYLENDQYDNQGNVLHASCTYLIVPSNEIWSVSNTASGKVLFTVPSTLEIRITDAK